MDLVIKRLAVVAAVAVDEMKLFHYKNNNICCCGVIVAGAVNDTEKYVRFILWYYEQEA